MNRHPNRIYQLIRRLDKVGPLTPEKIDRYNKELWAVLDLIMPSEIYQYRAGDEGHFMALEQEKVYLSDPVRFNDPTDGLCYVDFDDVLLETVLEQDYRSAMRRRGSRASSPVTSASLCDRSRERRSCSGSAMNFLYTLTRSAPLWSSTRPVPRRASIVCCL